ncbi:hypothetical protein [Thioalkalivibrio paradoxus]|uniref:Uncharacterized protein n=1 Tax=Thioalkalivibrio paradoxus ARh 1 TaxID=713585 RepID=W0DJJ3_9GAMM|nr:hypothetical protein [Thioalkalivibrio paradoxus]AHE97060.1 hypothetical protein THITH_00815 [Thioalkalivibrio paradoxus ARh 1]
MPRFLRSGRNALLAAGLLLAGLLAFAATAAAGDAMRPFILAPDGAGDPQTRLNDARNALEGAGFEVVGEYAPYPQARVLVVTSEALRQAAAASDSGAYAAAQRVAATATDGGTELAFTNPRYMAAAYRLGDDLDGVASSMEAALGRARDFGSEEGKSVRDLNRYRYMIRMPRFDDPLTLATHSSHAAAVAAVEAGLAAGAGDTAQVYRIDIPGRDQVLFGVALLGGEAADAHIMGNIDGRSPHHTPHLPYELLVDGDTVQALDARFRIAINFPDLSMMGSGSFMSIRSAPDAIAESLAAAANHAP